MKDLWAVPSVCKMSISYLFSLMPAIELYCFVFSGRGEACKISWKTHQQIDSKAQAAIFRWVFLFPYQRQVTSICYLKQKNCTVLVVQTGEECATCFSFGQNSCISHLAISIGTFKSRLPCVSCLIMLEETLATVFQLQWVCNVPLSLWSLTFS